MIVPGNAIEELFLRQDIGLMISSVDSKTPALIVFHSLPSNEQNCKVAAGSKTPAEPGIASLASI